MEPTDTPHAFATLLMLRFAGPDSRTSLYDDEVFRNDGFVSHASPLCPLAFVFVRFVARMNYTNARDLFAHDCRMLAAVENIL